MARITLILLFMTLGYLEVHASQKVFGIDLEGDLSELTKLFGGQLMVLNSAVTHQSGFEDLGDAFKFLDEGGQPTVRRKSEYFDYRGYYEKNPIEAKRSLQTRALIMGGCHLSAKEAFELSKSYAKEGKRDMMLNGGYLAHVNHVVLNSDPATKPDHQVDFTIPGIVKTLNLEAKFDMVLFENVKPSVSLMNLEAQKNAFDALKPGGQAVFYGAIPGIADLKLEEAGFTHYQVIQDHYDEFLAARLDMMIPMTIAKKTESSGNSDKEK